MVVSPVPGAGIVKQADFMVLRSILCHYDLAAVQCIRKRASPFNSRCDRSTYQSSLYFVELSCLDRRSDGSDGRSDVPTGCWHRWLKFNTTSPIFAANGLQRSGTWSYAPSAI